MYYSFLLTIGLYSKILPMLERFKRRPVEDISPTLPDVQFIGFEHPDFPFRVGIDIDAYQKMLQDTMQIQPKDMPKISLRFIGFVPQDKIDQVNSDLQNFGDENPNRFIRIISMHNEIPGLTQAAGVSFAHAETDSASSLIKDLIGTKLLFETYAVKAEMLDRKLHGSKILRVAKRLDSSILYGSELAGLEYLLRNFEWPDRLGILFLVLIDSKLALTNLKNRYKRRHVTIKRDINTQMQEDLNPSDEGEISDAAVEKWSNLVTVYPVEFPKQ